MHHVENKEILRGSRIHSHRSGQLGANQKRKSLAEASYHNGVLSADVYRKWLKSAVSEDIGEERLQTKEMDQIYFEGW